MMRVIVGIAFAGSILLFTGIASAQFDFNIDGLRQQFDADGFRQQQQQQQQRIFQTDPTRPAVDIFSREQIQQRIEEQSDQLRQQREQIRQRIDEQQLMPRPDVFRPEAFTQEQIQERIQGRQEQFEVQRREALEQVEQRRAEFQAQAEEMRQEQLEEFERRRQEFLERVAQIQDEQRRALALRLSEQINMVNQHMSDAALRYLDALELVLGKIEARAGIIEDATGADLAPVRSEIAAGLQRIEEARAAVIGQKSKQYVIELESQETIGRDIRAAMQEVHDDHQALRERILRPLNLLVRDVMLVLQAAVEEAGEEATEALHEEFGFGEIQEGEVQEGEVQEGFEVQEGETRTEESQ